MKVEGMMWPMGRPGFCLSVYDTNTTYDEIPPSRASHEAIAKLPPEE